MKRILLAAAVMLIASCSKNSNTGDEPSPVKPTQIPINVSMGVWTRATDTAYESGDKVGIYVVNYNGSAAGTLQSSGNHVDNMRFSYKSIGRTRPRKPTSTAIIPTALLPMSRPILSLRRPTSRNWRIIRLPNSCGAKHRA